MSKTTQKKKTNSPRSNGSGRNSVNKKPLWIATFVILISALLIFWLTIGESLLRQAEMASYLKNKYNEDFVVSMPHKKASGLGMEGYLEYTAHPKNNDKIAFTAVSSSSSKSDDYPGAVWSSQEHERLKPVIKETLGDVAYSVKIQSAFSLQTKDISIKGAVPPFNSAASKYGNKIPYRLIVENYVGKNPSEDQKLKIINDIINIASHLPDNVDSRIEYITSKQGGGSYGIILSVEEALRFVGKPNELLTKFKEWGK